MSWPKSPLCPPLRPPGACAEQEFLSRCIHCGQCAHACPHGAITMAGTLGLKRNTPELHPGQKPCWLCMKCPPLCPTGALDPQLRDPEKVRMGRAVILRDRCHNFVGEIMCSTCYDRCPLRGSAVVLEHGIQPAITDHCVGCGVCEYVCPVRAVVTLPLACMRDFAASGGGSHGH